MGSSKKIASGVIWTTISNIVNGVYGFISVPILLNYFGKSDYGLIGLAMSVNIYLRLMDMGLNSTNVRFFANWLEKQKHDRVKRLFQTSLAFYGTIGLVNAFALVVVGINSNSFFNITHEQNIILEHLFFILAISAFISWFSSCFDQIIRANECVGWIQKYSLLPRFIQIIVLGLTVLCKLNIELYYALTAFSLFIVIPLYINKIKVLCPYICFIPRFDLQILKEIIPYSLNIFSFSIFQFSLYNLRPVFLAMRGTIESVADYRVLNGVIGIVTMLGGAFLSVLLPSASKAVARHDKTAYNKVAYDGTKYISIMLCFCCFGMVSVSSEVLEIYVGQQYLYLNGWLIVWLLTTLITHNQAISSLILSGSDIRAITYNSIIASITGLVICWITIPQMQIGGTIIGFAAYGLVQILFYYLYYWPQKMGINSIKVFSYSFAPYVLIGGIVAIVVANLPINLNSWLTFFLKGSVFSILYFPLVYLKLNKNDKSFFLNLIKR